MGGLRDWTFLPFLFAFYEAGQTLQITGIGVPPTAISGDTVTLSCSFELSGDELYSLTWWKDDKIFFSYVPTNKHPKTAYTRPGITVDKSISTLHEVVLSHVDHRASGKLRCEVLADKPTFEQDTMDANMTVIDIPARGPTITGRRDIYHVGDLLLLNCSSPYSFPPTTLSWHINGHLASRETVVVYPGETDSEGCEASWSGLQMRLHRDHFQEGVLILRCTASILHVYRLSTEVMITDSNYIESSPRESPSTGDAGCSSMLVLLLLLPLLLSTLGT